MTLKAQLESLRGQYDTARGPGSAATFAANLREQKGQATLKDQVEAFTAALSPAPAAPPSAPAAPPAPQPPAPATAPVPAPAGDKLTAASALLGEYETKTGRERTKFFIDNEAALFAAAETVEQASKPAPVKPAAAALDSARALLGEYHALRGRERTAFFRENEKALFTASKLLESNEEK